MASNGIHLIIYRIMKEKILKTFHDLGFVLDDLEDMGYGFKYEGTHFLWAQSDDDDSFLSIVVPMAYKRKDDDDDLSFYRMIDKFNQQFKYVKANEFHGSVWMVYERELMGEENLEMVLTRMILHLERDVHFFRNWNKEVLGDEEDEDSFDDEDTDDCEELTEE